MLACDTWKARLDDLGVLSDLKFCDSMVHMTSALAQSFFWMKNSTLRALRSDSLPTEKKGTFPLTPMGFRSSPYSIKAVKAGIGILILGGQARLHLNLGLLRLASGKAVSKRWDNFLQTEPEIGEEPKG